MTERSLAPTLKVPAFRRLWLGLITFNVGHLIQVVGSSWLILDVTSSPLWVSLMIGAPTLPLLVLSLPAGAAADLFDRRRILVVSASIMTFGACSMAVLDLLDEVTPPRLVFLGLVIGIGVAFLNPALQAIVRDLVPTSLVPGAVSLNSTTGGVANAVGPVIGGLLVARFGAGVAFLVASVGYLTMVIVSIRTRAVDPTRDRAGMGNAIATGVRYIRFSPDLLSMLLLGSLFGFTSAALRAMLPSLTEDALGGGAVAYGLLLGSFGVGAVVGGLSRGIGSSVLRSFMVPASIVATGLVGVVAGQSQVFVVTGVAVFCAGLLWSWILATMISMFQLLSPGWVRGRLMSAFILSVFGFIPIGSVVAGQIGDVYGASVALTVFSIGVVVVGFASLRLRLPVVEDIEPPVSMGAADLATAKPAPSDEIHLPGLVVNRWRVPESEFEDFTAALGELRRIRLSTGAREWGVYRSATERNRVVEVYRAGSWEDHVQQQERIDSRAQPILERLATYRDTGVPQEFLVAIEPPAPGTDESPSQPDSA